MKKQPIVVCFLCFALFACSSSSTLGQIIAEDGDETANDENYLDEIKAARTEYQYDILLRRLMSMKGGNDPLRDFYILGETNGSRARFYILQGASLTAKQIIRIGRTRNVWRVYGKTDTAAKAQKMTASSRNRYLSSLRSQRRVVG